MSFYFGMLIVLPVTQDLFVGRKRKKVLYERRVMWNIEYVMNLGIIKAPRPGKTYSDLSPRARASLYLFDSLWPGLGQYVEGDALEFAPEFTVMTTGLMAYVDLERMRSSVEQWMEEFSKSPKPSQSFVVPIAGTTMMDQVPTQYTMESHNRALENDFFPRTTRELCDPSAPLVWAECSQVSEWIDVGTKSHASPIRSDHEALPFFTMWETCMRECGRLGGRCIFLLGHSAYSLRKVT